MNVKTIIKSKFPTLFTWVKKGQNAFFVLLGKYFPKTLIQMLYKSYYGKPIDLKHPKDIDEKVNYMKLYSDTSLWSLCADKYEVRNYVEGCGLGHTLNELYGVFDSPEAIDFESLPNQFVIKTTNGGGGNSVLIIKDKSTMDVKNVVQTLNAYLKIPTGYMYAESHYNRIKPRLFVEKFMESDSDSESLVDYKFNCFDGKVYSVFLCSDRDLGKSVHYSVYDLEWNLYPEKMKAEYATHKVFDKPSSLDLMIQYSSILSKGIPYVRVDWYEVNGKPIFGEMTFTPAGGFQQFYSEEYRNELGDQCDLFA